ncbi:MAG: hypothetical protein C0404_08195 [Verrucomicrobia bacterium]|nr:hypothetical protein [Verrucomicrobiota bacterium]
MRKMLTIVACVGVCRVVFAADPTSSGVGSREDSGGQIFPKPYSPPCVERENVFEFTEKPAVKVVGPDKYEITFAVRGNCDVTVGIVDSEGRVIRHIGSGVLGSNAPVPFQRNSLKQTVYWNGKDDLEDYVREPEKLRVSVKLGLKPAFDKLLGPTSPKALPGFVWGIAADADGVYVFTKCRHRGHIGWRKFDHGAKYLKDLYPPPAGLPPEKMGGMGYIEYEPGKRAIHAPAVNVGMWRDGLWMPKDFDGDLYGIVQCRPVVANGRIYLFSSGGPGVHRQRCVSNLHYFGTDGSTEYAGVVGRPWFETDANTQSPRLAVSPDGKKLYLVGLHARSGAQTSGAPVLLGGPLDAGELAKVLVGKVGTPGSDDRHLGDPRDVACDSAGRVYVADRTNNRIQIYSPDGACLKTLDVERPELVQVHRESGVVYVAHPTRIMGKSVPGITRFAPYPGLQAQRHWDGIPAVVMTLDSWSPKPRLWICGQMALITGTNFSVGEGAVLRVYEDDGEELKIISDFEEEAREDAGANYIEWQGGIGYHVVCDPIRDLAYYANRWVFDLKTGRLRGPATIGRHSPAEIAFDKRGYMHIRHGNHGAPKNVVRVDTSRVVDGQFVEVPYDYGVEMPGYAGVLKMPATDTQFYSWGIGVNMRGDLAAVNWIGYSPRFQGEVDDDIGEYFRSGRGMGVYVHDAYGKFMTGLKEMERQGEELFYVRPRPGIDLVGAVIWTFTAGGEIANKEAVLVGGYRTNGVQLDEDGFLYFTNGRQRYREGRLFLQDRGGNFGGEPYVSRNRTPFTGTYIKVAPGRALFQVRQPKISSDWKPNRPPDLATPGFGGGGVDTSGGRDVWAESVEWMYAGASPIVADHCSCPHMRVSLDWYKRSFVPEDYRHSIGVLDSNGNLVCHIGQYGNLDSGRGPDSPIPLDGDGIAMTRGAYVSATDNYLAIADWGRRLIVARLNYNAEESVGIK